jgi:hypothetical protein
MDRAHYRPVRERGKTRWCSWMCVRDCVCVRACVCVHVTERVRVLVNVCWCRVVRCGLQVPRRHPCGSADGLGQAHPGTDCWAGAVGQGVRAALRNQLLSVLASCSLHALQCTRAPLTNFPTIDSLHTAVWCLHAQYLTSCFLAFSVCRLQHSRVPNGAFMVVSECVLVRMFVPTCALV